MLETELSLNAAAVQRSAIPFDGERKSETRVKLLMGEFIAGRYLNIVAVLLTLVRT